MHVHGSNGASIGVQTDGGAMFIAGTSTIAEPPVNDLWTVPGEAAQLKQWQREDPDLFRSVDPNRDFLAAIAENRASLIPGEDGRNTVELFTAIYRSQCDRAPVCFPLPADDGRGDYDGRQS